MFYFAEMLIRSLPKYDAFLITVWDAHSLLIGLLEAFLFFSFKVYIIKLEIMLLYSINVYKYINI